jgi:flagellin
VTDTSIIDNGGTAAGTADTLAGGNTQNIDIASVGQGFGYQLTLDDSGTANVMGTTPTFEYVAGAGDSAEDVAENLFKQVNDYLQANSLQSSYSIARVGDQLQITNNRGATGNDLTITAASSTGGTPAAAGGLGALTSIDVSTAVGATTALGQIDDLIKVAVDAAAAFGTAQNQIDTQSDFVGKLTDSLKSGIGALVDANMEETSARLKALQTQQQLAVQSLTIANQAPQALAQLFR